MAIPDSATTAVPLACRGITTSTMLRWPTPTLTHSAPNLAPAWHVWRRGRCSRPRPGAGLHRPRRTGAPRSHVTVERVWGTLVLFLLLALVLLIADAAHGQVQSIQFLDSSSNIIATLTQQVRIQCSTNTTCTRFGNMIVVTATGGGGGSGTVTSVTAGTGLTASPSNPITTTGTLSLADPQFIDVNTSPFVITQTFPSAVAYLDCNTLITGPAPHCTGSLSIADGIVDGQLLTLVCSSNFAGNPGGGWTITAHYDVFSSLVFGTSSSITLFGSYDLGGTYVDGTQTSCGAELMWSNTNSYWELVNIYGGTTS